MQISFSTPQDRLFNHGNGELVEHISKFIPKVTDRVSLSLVNKHSANSMSRPTENDVKFMECRQINSSAITARLSASVKENAYRYCAIIPDRLRRQPDTGDTPRSSLPRR